MAPSDTPDPDRSDTNATLRTWAKGLYSSEAATELLIRAFGGRFAEPHWPWIHQESDGQTWVEFDAIPDNIGRLSGGERRVLTFVAGLGASAPIDLADVVSGLGRDNVALLLAALSHAAGTQEQVEYIPTPTSDGVPVLDPTSPRLNLGPLCQWPEP